MSDLVEMAEELRERGMSLAANAQDLISPLWSDRCYAALLKLARTHSTIHVDQLLAAFPEKPSHPNAFGAIWMRAIREHNIIHSGRVKPSADPTKHRHQYPVYLSLIFRRDAQ